jgi:hypothetical protein
MINVIPFITIGVPTLNRSEFICEVIDSLLNQDYPKDKMEIIIVNNGSTDTTERIIKEKYLKNVGNNIKLISLRRNIGAPAAYNTAIRYAHKDFDFFCKMDDDVVLDSNCLREMIACTKRIHADKLGVLGAKVYYYWDKKRIHAVGSNIKPYYVGGRAIGKNVIDNGCFDQDMFFSSVNGCLMLVKRDVIEKVGMLDETYFIYYDDHDWSKRIEKAGYKHLYCFRAVAYHNTLPQKRFYSKFWLYYSTRNSFLFIYKNYVGFKRIIGLMAIHVNMLRSLIQGILTTKDKNYLSIINAIFKGYKAGITQRGNKRIITESDCLVAKTQSQNEIVKQRTR